MAINVETLAAAMGYTKSSIAGAGAIKGKNCVITDISEIEGGHRITFQWTLDNGTVQSDTMDVMDGQDGENGRGIKSVDINAQNHLIITYDDDTTKDAGKISGGGGSASWGGITGTLADQTDLKNALDAKAEIDDITPTSNKVYSSEKVEEKFFRYEKDITTRQLKVTPNMELSNISSTDTLYLFANDNIAYTSDVAENTNKGVTYKIKDGLIYLNGTAESTFYISCDVMIPKSWAGCGVLGKLEIVSGTITTQNIRMKLPATYMSSGQEKQLAIAQNGNTNLAIVNVTNDTPQIQVSTGAVCTNLVLRPFLVFRTKAWSQYGWTDLPTPSRQTISGTTLSNASGILMTKENDFSAHVKNRYSMDNLFGKRMVLCGDSIAYGHQGDSFGVTIANKNNMALDKPAVGSARFTSNSESTSITTQVCSLTRGYDFILVEGGINDALHNETLGTLTSDYSSATYDETTVLGAVEKAMKFLVENYPNAKKLFVLCHKCTNSSYVPYAVQDTYFDAIITALKKWNIPYIDLREFPLCGYNATYASTYFNQSDFQSVGGLHPNTAGYALGYVDQITEKLKNI